MANRGEIARRIIRAIHEMDKVALAVYAENDRELPFVEEADESWSLGSGDLSSTYLLGEALLHIAREARADAIHPGYGFLAENASFAWACQESGIHFIGPSAEVIDLMGHKSRARETVSRLGIPVLEGETGDLKTLVEKRFRLSYPLLVKPAAGGGGKGMRIVRTAESFEQEAREASREALAYFGSGEIYVERFLEGPRHVEVQVMADHHGNRVHLFERECSLQRRYQKIVEEAPSGFLSEDTRRQITSAALELIRGIDYTNAGTVEFLVDANQQFYFMEMNTRIQVEHPVTELLTGIDLVKEQIAIAEGRALSFSQEDLSLGGHAMEVRLYAEDPSNNFLPSSGSLDAFDLPGDRELRIDSGYRAGNRVGPWYDPMLAKLVVRGKHREDARRRMVEALKKTHVAGLSTNRDFLLCLLRSDHFTENRIHTGYLDQEIRNLLSAMDKRRAAIQGDGLLAAAAFVSLYPGEESTGSPWQQIGHWRILPGITVRSAGETHLIRYRRGKSKEHMWFSIGDRESQVILEHRTGRHFRLRIREEVLELWAHKEGSEIYLDADGHRFVFRRPDIPDRRYIPREEGGKGPVNGKISAPLNGRVVEIHVKKGDRVAEGEAMLVIESMKMENKILAEQEATVEQIEVSVGQQVRTNQILLTLASE